MDGEIRLGRWLRFHASQVVSPPWGFLWAAKARMGPFTITGYDRYANDVGEMRWRLAGLVPVMNAAGPDLTRSAAGRLAVDAFFVPTAFLGPSVTWKESTAPDWIELSWAVGRFEIPVSMHVDESGALDRIAMKRWGNPLGQPWGEYAFGGYVEDEAEFDGIRIPTTLRAGWFFGTQRWAEGEFFRARIRSATFS